MTRPLESIERFSREAAKGPMIKHDVTTSETFISVDIAADGPIAGPHSMLSLGAAAFGLEAACDEPSPRWHSRMRGTFSEERGHVAAALIFLKQRHGSWGELATALDMRGKTLAKGAASPRRSGPGIALRVAALAGVPVGDLLAGRWPAPGTCPLCGGHVEVPPSRVDVPEPASAGGAAG